MSLFGSSKSRSNSAQGVFGLPTAWLEGMAGTFGLMSPNPALLLGNSQGSVFGNLFPDAIQTLGEGADSLAMAKANPFAVPTAGPVDEGGKRLWTRGDVTSFMQKYDPGKLGDLGRKKFQNLGDSFTAEEFLKTIESDKKLSARSKGALISAAGDLQRQERLEQQQKKKYDEYLALHGMPTEGEVAPVVERPAAEAVPAAVPAPQLNPFDQAIVNWANRTATESAPPVQAYAPTPSLAQRGVMNPFSEQRVRNLIG